MKMNDPQSRERYWIGVIPCRAIKTVLVKADSFREAQRKLADGLDVEGVSVNYEGVCKGRIICEDKVRTTQ